jgi:hypothetical protein
VISMSSASAIVRYFQDTSTGEARRVTKVDAPLGEDEVAGFINRGSGVVL